MLYGVNNLVDYCLGLWGSYIIADTPFPKFMIMLIICDAILTIHVWFQPYKSKGLNILDSFILLCLVGLLFSALEAYGSRMIGVIFWFLPLLIFINYMASFTTLKYLTIPYSCVGVFVLAAVYGSYGSIFAILLLAISLITFIAYIVHMVKNLYTTCCQIIRPRYLAINEQNDEADENNDNDNAEVSIHI